MLKGSNMNKKMKSIIVGKAGEYRIMSELLMHNFNSIIPAIDEGVDVFLENGISIQIKTTNTYLISLTQTGVEHGRQISKKRTFFADFMIVWVIPSDTFFIIPIEKIDTNKQSLWFKNNKQFDKYIDNWSLLNNKKQNNQFEKYVKEKENPSIELQSKRRCSLCGGKRFSLYQHQHKKNEPQWKVVGFMCGKCDHIWNIL